MGEGVLKVLKEWRMVNVMRVQIFLVMEKLLKDDLVCKVFISFKLLQKKFVDFVKDEQKEMKVVENFSIMVNFIFVVVLVKFVDIFMCF